jgi:hypothetical protein
MIPPGAAGRGAGKDKDGEHRAPSYLHTRENAEEMIGRLPLVGPPVLGDWARPADTTAAGGAPNGPDSSNNDSNDGPTRT